MILNKINLKQIDHNYTKDFYLFNLLISYNAHLGNKLKNVHLFSKNQIICLRGENKLKLKTIMNLNSFIYIFKNIFLVIKTLFYLNPENKIMFFLAKDPIFNLFIYKLCSKKTNKLHKFTLHFGKWIGGSFTNVKNSKIIKRIPNFFFVSDVFNNKNIIRECRNLKLPICGLIDNNINPNIVNYPLFYNTKSHNITIFLINSIINYINVLSNLEKKNYLSELNLNVNSDINSLLSNN